MCVVCVLCVCVAGTLPQPRSRLIAFTTINIRARATALAQHPSRLLDLLPAIPYPPPPSSTTAAASQPRSPPPLNPLYLSPPSSLSNGLQRLRAPRRIRRPTRSPRKRAVPPAKRAALVHLRARDPVHESWQSHPSSPPRGHIYLAPLPHLRHHRGNPGQADLRRLRD